MDITLKPRKNKHLNATGGTPFFCNTLCHLDAEPLGKNLKYNKYKHS